MPCAWFCVMIESVWCEPYSLMCAMASSRLFTTRMARIGARYSVRQSSSVAGTESICASCSSRAPCSSARSSTCFIR